MGDFGNLPNMKVKITSFFICSHAASSESFLPRLQWICILCIHWRSTTEILGFRCWCNGFAEIVALPHLIPGRDCLLLSLLSGQKCLSNAGFCKSRYWEPSHDSHSQLWTACTTLVCTITHLISSSSSISIFTQNIWSSAVFAWLWPQLFFVITIQILLPGYVIPNNSG